MLRSPMRARARTWLAAALLPLPAVLWGTPSGAADPSADAYERGVSAYYDGRLSEAAKEFEKAAAEDPKSARAYLDAAVVYRDLEQHERARALLAQAAELKPDDPDIQAALGWAAMRAGDRLAASAAFSVARILEPSNEQSLLGLARLEMAQRNPREAVNVLTALLTAHPEFTLAHVFEARAQEAAGERQGAVEEYKRAINSDPLYSEARLWLAPLYARMQLFNEAWQQYNKVLNVAPRNGEARREAARVRRLVTGSTREVLPQRKLKEFLPVVGAGGGKGMPEIRVAVGTTVQGNPAPKKEIAFLCSGRFELFDPDSGKRINTGPADKAWLARKVEGKKGKFEVVDEKGERKARFSRSIGVRPLDPAKDSTIFQRLQLAEGTAWTAQGDRQLKGTVEIRGLGSRGLYLVNRLLLEDYVYGVVNGEMPSHFPPEAQKAQAVIARTEALYAKEVLHRHKRYGYDMCDGQHCQVYGGIEEETPVGRSAVDETRGLTLKAPNGKLARTPYSSNCGGHTQASADVPGWGVISYLRGRKDVVDGDVERKSPWELDRWVKGRPQVFCNVPKYMHPAQFRWSRVISAADLGERIRARNRKFGLLRSARILRRSPSGNVNKIEFRGTKGRLVVDREHIIRGILGLSSARSTMFVLETERDEKGSPVELTLYGGGWGHGIGLCQLGAAGRADAGQSYQDILGHYYAGAVLNRLPYAPPPAQAKPKVQPQERPRDEEMAPRAVQKPAPDGK